MAKVQEQQEVSGALARARAKWLEAIRYNPFDVAQRAEREAEAKRKAEVDELARQVAALEAVQAEQRAKAVAAFRPEEQAAAARVVKAMETLAQEQAALADVRGKIAELDGYIDLFTAPFLPDAAFALERWRAELASRAQEAERRRDPKKYLLAEAEEALQRTLKNYQVAIQGGQRAANQEVEVRIAAERVEELTGRWPVGLPVRRERSERW